MRRRLIAGNWKMNLSYRESEKLAKDLSEKISEKDLSKTDVLVCPPYISLGIVNKTIKDTGIRLGAQNLFYENDGAFTGEISAAMLKSVGCEYVIIGHSERRTVMHETNLIVNKKIRKALESGLKVILCVGENLVEREDEIYEGIIEKQITESLNGVTEEEMKNMVIAYEPVWAIGTGLNATPEQAGSIHQFIGKVLCNLYSQKTADDTIIIYGGSVNVKNAKEILSACGIDGALIGGASLKSDDFSEIVKTAALLK